MEWDEGHVSCSFIFALRFIAGVCGKINLGSLVRLGSEIPAREIAFLLLGLGLGAYLYRFCVVTSV